jgi:hypothetical protein
MLQIRPCSLKFANSFVSEHHRHSSPSRGHKFSVSVWDTDTDTCVGVAIAGRPVARRLDDGLSLEVLRVVTLGHRNACSMLYGACRKAGVAMGYTAIYTYTLASETGASCRAAGFIKDAESPGVRSAWNTRPGRTGGDARSAHPKVRWAWRAASK